MISKLQNGHSASYSTYFKNGWFNNYSYESLSSGFFFNKLFIKEIALFDIPLGKEIFLFST